MTPPRQPVGRAVAEALEAEGVSTVFGIPGGHMPGHRPAQTGDLADEAGRLDPQRRVALAVVRQQERLADMADDKLPAIAVPDKLAGGRVNDPERGVGPDRRVEDARFVMGQTRPLRPASVRSSNEVTSSRGSKSRVFARSSQNGLPVSG